MTKEPNVLFLLPQYGSQVTTPFFEAMLSWAQEAGKHGVEWNVDLNRVRT